MYIAKYLTKIYICLDSKIPHGKKREKKFKKLKEIIENKKPNKKLSLEKKKTKTHFKKWFQFLKCIFLNKTMQVR